MQFLDHLIDDVEGLRVLYCEGELLDEGDGKVREAKLGKYHAKQEVHVEFHLHHVNKLLQRLS
jgi:hypothetical protein